VEKAVAICGIRSRHPTARTSVIYWLWEGAITAVRWDGLPASAGYGAIVPNASPKNPPLNG